MGAMGNSAALMGNQTWAAWLTAGAAFVANEVYNEAANTPDHEIRLRLANDVLTVPSLITAKLVTMVSITPNVASIGPDPSDAHEGPALARIRQLWTSLAKNHYP